MKELVRCVCMNEEYLEVSESSREKMKAPCWYSFTCDCVLVKVHLCFASMYVNDSLAASLKFHFSDQQKAKAKRFC